ncbi:hypothetical protein J2Z31_004402 [Sinorhizobium kostiense]|uniref:Uncharacterized protein n=1 Tax=Sinorhizobium kostiense TaxID=76747 RepID=A0ABS4R4Q5_9HYPH|nr:hypothetical protein [Sinorhizobium kostiense]
MLQGMPKLIRQLAMGDKHKSDHGYLCSNCIRNSSMVRYRNAAISSICWGGHLGKEKAKCKSKMPKNQPFCLCERLNAYFIRQQSDEGVDRGEGTFNGKAQ